MKIIQQLYSIFVAFATVFLKNKYIIRTYKSNKKYLIDIRKMALLKDLYTRKEWGKMKVIKRDGRTIEFDRDKIEVAIEKANKEVRGKEKATKDEINEIIAYIEDLGKKRMLVEDIQDVIEEKLMELDKYELAKKYIY